MADIIGLLLIIAFAWLVISAANAVFGVVGAIIVGILLFSR